MKHPFLSLSDENEPFAERMSEAAGRVVRSGMYIGGSEVDAFERALAESMSVGCVVGVSNGLDALRLILSALVELKKLQPGDEVIFPANTFIATALAISQAGLTAVAADVDPSTMLLSATTVEDALTERTRAILPVHLYGRVCAEPSLSALAASRGLIIVEDAAQAIGANGVGKIGVAAALSFYPTKNLGAVGDGGAVVTDNPAIAEMVRRLANYGCSERNHYPIAGYNCRLDPIQAAMLGVKLPYLAEINERRADVAATYSREIVNPLVKKPAAALDGKMVWHQYVVAVPADVRDDFRSYLSRNGVATDIHYPVPVHCQPPFVGSVSRQLPVVEALARQIVSLPVGAPTNVDAAREIAAVINSWNPLRNL
ncbi:MAG: DegT/DnrJ/EryC1/StrS family aminotransferase [Roseburia sp.]|nr:DegT/DnrJ/EryC1/StrS family aminotransferase [Roseburia sp.]